MEREPTSSFHFELHEEATTNGKRKKNEEESLPLAMRIQRFEEISQRLEARKEKCQRKDPTMSKEEKEIKANNKEETRKKNSAWTRKNSRLT